MRRPDAAAVEALLARYGLRAARWRVVAKLDCTVLRIKPTRGPDDLSLRIYPAAKHALAPIATELAWLRDLADHGVAVPRPLADREGRSVQPWPDGRHAVLLSWLRGRFLDAGLRPLHLRRTGRLIAHLQNSADRLAKAGQINTRRAADAPDLAAWARDARPPSRAWPRPAQAAASRAAQALIEEIATWPGTAASRGMLHGDLHPWNLVYASGEAGAIDFSDCGWGWRALDFASTLQYLQHPLAGNHDHRARYPALREQLLEGYAELRPLWPGAERQIDALITARWLNTVEWILDDWPRTDLRPFGPGLLRGVVPILAAAGRPAV